jgi:hypothetical protein
MVHQDLLLHRSIFRLFGFCYALRKTGRSLRPGYPLTLLIRVIAIPFLTLAL